jgi:hypothetical protein
MKTETTLDLTRALNKACRDLHAREITLRYLPPPSINRWLATALIDHHRVVDKLRQDIPAGELNLQDIERFADQPIARGAGATPVEAVKNLLPLAWRAPGNG